MARNILLILGNGLGSSLGPNFNLTSNAGAVTPSTATRTQLLAGLIVSVDDIATQVTVTSTGRCTNSITQSIPCVSTTTSTTSTTTTPPTTTSTTSTTSTSTTSTSTTTTSTSTTTTTTTTAAPTTTTTTSAPEPPAECDEGMDVVFLVDYTGSMGNAINGIKATIAQIVQTIINESLNNYRLGLVLFDEYTSGTVSNYSSQTAYTSLPSAQRYINVGGTGRFQWLTAMEKMQTNNSTSFETQLDLLNTTNFPLGGGFGGPEPSDIGVDLIGTNNKVGYEYFAGTFRTGVSKLIILITDNFPGGPDDVYNQTDIDFVNGLTPQLLSQNIRVLLMTTAGNNVLYDLATGTNGLVSNNFTGAAIITALENICSPGTTTTTTESPPL